MKKSVCLFLLFGVFLSFSPLVFAGSTEGTVSVEFANRVGNCSRDSNSSGWLNEDLEITNYTVKNGILQDEDCFMYDEANDMYLSDYSCCPSGWNACVTQIGSEFKPGGRCREKVELCSSLTYDGNLSCITAGKEVAERTLGVSEKFIQYLDSWNGICYEYSSAKCIWMKPNATEPYSCQASFVNITDINETIGGNCTKPTIIQNCIYIYNGQKDNCDTDIQTITVNYTTQFSAKYLNGTNVTNITLLTQLGANCQNTSKEYSCSASIQLPSFSVFNFLVSILGIGMVYFLFKKNFKEID